MSDLLVPLIEGDWGGLRIMCAQESASGEISYYIQATARSESGTFRNAALPPVRRQVAFGEANWIVTEVPAGQTLPDTEYLAADELLVLIRTVVAGLSSLTSIWEDCESWSIPPAAVCRDHHGSWQLDLLVMAKSPPTEWPSAVQAIGALIAWLAERQGVQGTGALARPLKRIAAACREGRYSSLDEVLGAVSDLAGGALTRTEGHLSVAKQPKPSFMPLVRWCRAAFVWTLRRPIRSGRRRWIGWVVAATVLTAALIGLATTTAPQRGNSDAGASVALASGPLQETTPDKTEVSVPPTQARPWSLTLSCPTSARVDTPVICRAELVGGEGVPPDVVWDGDGGDLETHGVQAYFTGRSPKIYRISVHTDRDPALSVAFITVTTNPRPVQTAQNATTTPSPVQEPVPLPITEPAKLPAKGPAAAQEPAAPLALCPTDAGDGGVLTRITLDGVRVGYAYVFPNPPEPYLSVCAFNALFGKQMSLVQGTSGWMGVWIGNTYFTTKDYVSSTNSIWMKMTPKFQQLSGVKFRYLSSSDGLHFITSR